MIHFAHYRTFTLKSLVVAGALSGLAVLTVFVVSAADSSLNVPKRNDERGSFRRFLSDLLPTKTHMSFLISFHYWWPMSFKHSEHA